MHRYNQLPEADRPDLATWVGKDGAARSDSLVAHVFGTVVEESPVPAARSKKTTVPAPTISQPLFSEIFLSCQVIMTPALAQTFLANPSSSQSPTLTAFPSLPQIGQSGASQTILLIRSSVQ